MRPMSSSLDISVANDAILLTKDSPRDATCTLERPRAHCESMRTSSIPWMEFVFRWNLFWATLAHHRSPCRTLSELWDTRRWIWESEMKLECFHEQVCTHESDRVLSFSGSPKTSIGRILVLCILERYLDSCDTRRICQKQAVLHMALHYKITSVKKEWTLRCRRVTHSKSIPFLFCWTKPRK